jgi:GT2 family glycosyltransferase
VDLFLRAWQRDWRCVVVPEAKVYHAVGMSNSQAQSSGEKVANRRYVAGRSNSAVVGLKYFTGAALFWPVAVQILPLFSNIAKLRWHIVSGELRALALTVSRLPTIWAFRRANASYARSKPGQQFFLQPEYGDGQ